MRLLVDTGDSGLKRALKEVKNSNKILRDKSISLDNTIKQLTNQLEIKTELMRQIKAYQDDNKELSTTIDKREVEVGELVKATA